MFIPMALENNNKKEIGKEMEILIDEKAKGSLWAEEMAYRFVSVKGKYKLGIGLKVKIKNVTSNYMVA